MSRAIENIKKEIVEYRSKNIPIPNKTKQNILNYIGQDLSIRKLSTMIGIHHTTIARWAKNNPKSGLETGVRTGAHHGAGVVQGGACTKSGAHHPIPNDDNNKKLKDSPPCTTHAPPKFVMPLLFITFFISEYYLLSEAIKFHSFTLEEERFALVKSLLGELVPIVLTIVVSTCRVNIFQKSAVGFCLVIAFIFSAYSSGAYKFSLQSNQLNRLPILINKKRELELAINDKKKNIEFYKNQKQESTGIIGWPRTVMRLSEELDVLSKENLKINDEIDQIGDTDVSEVNKWINIVFKFFLQLSCVLITPFLSRYFIELHLKAVSPLSPVTSKEIEISVFADSTK